MKEELLQQFKSLNPTDAEITAFEEAVSHKDKASLLEPARRVTVRASGGKVTTEELIKLERNHTRMKKIVPIIGALVFMARFVWYAVVFLACLKLLNI